jgi:ABC-type amino acid transport substrate-binding protein
LEDLTEVSEVIETTLARDDSAKPSRRGVLKLGAGLAAGAGAFALAACTTGSTSNNAQASGSSQSLLDKWTASKSANIGMYVGGSSTLFKDPASGQLKGIYVDWITQLFKDMSPAGDIKLNFVEFPFAQLFPALAGGQIDMIGHGVTILPSRALKASFAALPMYYEGVVMWLKPGSNITSLAQLNKAGTRISVLAGSSQQFSGAAIFPLATLAPFADQTGSIEEANSGRAEGVLISSQQIPAFASKYPKMRILPGPQVFVDANTYLMPLGDYRLKEWITNWIWYQLTHNLLGPQYINNLRPGIQKNGLTIPIFTPDSIGDVVRTDVS